jgi:putative transposase
VKTYIEFYNHRRFHETLGYKKLMNVYNEGSNKGTPKEQLVLKAA